MWYVICLIVGIIAGFLLRGLIEAAKTPSSIEVELPPYNVDKEIEARAEQRIADSKEDIKGATDEQKTEMFNTMLDRKRERERKRDRTY